MENNLHTKGEWEVGSGHKYVVNCGKKHIAMINVFTDRDAEVSVSDAEGEGNAYLIAAAPDLLDALKGMLEWARRVKTVNPGMEVLNAINAISKAKND